MATLTPEAIKLLKAGKIPLFTCGQSLNGLPWKVQSMRLNEMLIRSDIFNMGIT